MDADNPIHFPRSRLDKTTKAIVLSMIEQGSSLNTIADKTGLAKTSIYYYSSKIQGKKYFEPDFRLNYSELEGEIVGIFTGDGSQYFNPKSYHYEVNIHFGNTDYDLYVKELFECYFNKPFRLNKLTNDKSRLRTDSKKIFNHFKNYLEYDSNQKHCTVKLKTIDFPEKFLIGFLRGFLDTDGCIAVETSGRVRVCFNTTSKKLAEQVKEILSIFGIAAGFSCQKRLGFKDYYCVHLLAQSIKPFLELVNPYKRKKLAGPVV